MKKFQDLTGQKIGRLTVLELVPKTRDSLGHLRNFWRCLCDCGRVKDIVSSSLISKGGTSCGCLHKELLIKQNNTRKGPIKHRAVTAIFNNYKAGAKRREIEFNLSREDFEEIMFEPCYFCGSPPQNVWRRPGDSIEYSGLDRVDNTQGYHRSNVVACCRLCNQGKTDLDTGTFYSWIIRLHKNLLDKGII